MWRLFTSAEYMKYIFSPENNGNQRFFDGDKVYIRIHTEDHELTPETNALRML